MNKRLLSLPLLVLVLCASLIAGCGGGDKKSDTGSPLSQVLSFFPKHSALVATVASDPNGPQVKAALDLVKKVPGGSLLLRQAGNSLSGTSEVDVNKDLIPALGSQIAVGANSTADINSRKVLIVLSASSADKLNNLLDKDKKGNPVESKGDYKGAKLYAEKNGGSVYAVDGKTLVLGDTESQIKAALDTRDTKTGLSEAAFNAASRGLPKDALVHVYGDAAAILNDTPTSVKARSVPWVAALKTYAVTISAEGSGLKLGFHLDTTGKPLTEAQLPMSAGAKPPALVDGPALVVGLRALAPSLTFAEDVAGKIDPVQYGQFRTALSVIRGRTKVDIEKDIVGQFTGDAVLGTDLGKTFVLRSEVKDPAALKASLAKLAPLAGNFLEGAGVNAAKVTKRPDGLYDVSAGSVKRGAYGVVGDKFVAGNASAENLKQAAGQSATSPLGSEGALALKLNGAQLVKLALANSNLGPIESIVTSLVGDLTGSARVETNGLTGQFSLAVK